MKYALVSDIHSNLPALEAVLADIERREDVGATYHLGDLVGYAPWPNETVAALEEWRIPGIAGNYDSTVATDYKHCGCKADIPPIKKSWLTWATSGPGHTSHERPSGRWGSCPSGWTCGPPEATSPAPRSSSFTARRR